MDNAAKRIKDIGPEPQSFDIERATKENSVYRSVAWSGRYLQVTLMSIPPGSDIGLEAHPQTDQFLRLDVRTIGRQSLETLKCGVISVDGRIRKEPRASRRLGRDFTRKGRARQQDPCL
jgi:hypothetical protein